MNNPRFDPDAEGRREAVLLGSHRRVGQASPLHVLDPELMGLIASANPKPTVERPIYRFQNFREPDDTAVVWPIDSPQSPYVCTIVDDGVVVLREAVPLPYPSLNAWSRLMYTSRLKEDMRVRFEVCMEMSKENHILKITEWLYNKGCEVLSRHECSTVAELEAFHASNKIGVELHLSMTRPMEVQRGPWTPIEEVPR